MKYEEWQKTRLHYKAVMEEITGILRRQNHVEEDKVVLVKGRDMLYSKHILLKCRRRQTPSMNRWQCSALPS